MRMAQKMTNGFDVKGIGKLYAFLKFYEDNHLKWKCEKDALNDVHSLNEIKKVTNSFHHKEKNTTQLKAININMLNDEFYYTPKTSEFMGILYHLRNSIAHAKIEKVDDKVIITDYDNSKTNPKCTAKGIIRYEIIQSIVDEINKKTQTT